MRTVECEQEKSELAVYAMAALEPAEADRVAAHVADCPSCEADTDGLLAVVTGLRLVPAEDMVGGDWDEWLPELREAAVRAALAENRSAGPAPGAAERPLPDPVPDPAAPTAHPPAATTPLQGHRPARRWNWALAAAVAGIALGIGGSLLLTQGDEPAALVLARPSGPDTVRSAGAGAVSGAVEPRSLGWGTEVLLELSGVDGPRRCSLVAVALDGSEETALTWQVPEGGYGLPGSPRERLLAVGGVGIPADRITRYAVRTAEGAELLSIPARPRPA
ncbi:hypothetical protein [Streptomyces lichenis]|uniref:Zinc-finger domain-containing protein n=1 Tax=Streptomyces lichenis TaxID=2306967 RepID=A0ABT0IA65_9ACTN|nr:hypothetical protein [Streptomyces lichenis]MCK8678203.1 hypothetical protein [Streptomyces lichenis]